MKYLAMLLLLSTMAMASGWAFIVNCHLDWWRDCGIQEIYCHPGCQRTAKVGKKVGHGTKHAAKVMVEQWTISG